jgi:hypothetical protein
LRRQIRRHAIAWYPWSPGLRLRLCLRRSKYVRQYIGAAVGERVVVRQDLAERKSRRVDVGDAQVGERGGGGGGGRVAEDGGQDADKASLEEEVSGAK